MSCIGKRLCLQPPPPPISQAGYGVLLNGDPFHSIFKFKCFKSWGMKGSFEVTILAILDGRKKKNLSLERTL